MCKLEKVTTLRREIATGIDKGIIGRSEKSFFLALLIWQVLRGANVVVESEWSGEKEEGGSL